jgi:hypothetical protein
MTGLPAAIGNHYTFDVRLTIDTDQPNGDGPETGLSVTLGNTTLFSSIGSIFVRQQDRH